MNKNHFLVYLIFVSGLLFVSCRSSFEFPARKEVVPMTTKNFTTVNGTYRNYNSDTARKYKTATCWYALYPTKKRFLYDTTQNDSAVVKLQMLSKKRLLAQLYQHDSLIKQRIIKGTIKDNYFVSKKRVHIFGIPAIYFTYADYCFRIGKTANGTLYVDAAHGHFGWMLLLFHAGSTKPLWFQFEKATQ